MRITVFTLLYLAAGVCYTGIAFGQPGLTSSFKKLLLNTSALLYLATVLSPFRFWQQPSYNSAQPRNQPTWIQKLLPWLNIAVALYSVIFKVLTAQPITEVIAQAVVSLPMFVRSLPTSMLVSINHLILHCCPYWSIYTEEVGWLAQSQRLPRSLTGSEQY